MKEAAKYAAGAASLSSKCIDLGGEENVGVGGELSFAVSSMMGFLVSLVKGVGFIIGVAGGEGNSGVPGELKRCDAVTFVISRRSDGLRNGVEAAGEGNLNSGVDGDKRALGVSLIVARSPVRGTAQIENDCRNIL